MDENKHGSCGLTETYNDAPVERLRENKTKNVFFLFGEEALRSFPSSTDILVQEPVMSCGIIAACAPLRTACAAARRKSEGGTSERFLSSRADVSVWLSCTE